MAEKVSFDPVTKIIQVTEAPVNSATTLDVSGDIYGAAKREWLANESLTKFAMPFATIGGQDIGGGKQVGSYFFLRTDLRWVIRPYEADHELTIIGNLYPFVAGSPVFVPTSGGYTTVVIYERSVLAQKVEASSDLTEIIRWLQADQELSPSLARRRDKDTKAIIWEKEVAGGNLLSTITLTEPEP
jgi:hypothetical protein